MREKIKMTDREMLLVAYGAMKTITDGTDNGGLLIVVNAIERHIFKNDNESEILKPLGDGRPA
jgi:hypothetical protein